MRPETHRAALLATARVAMCASLVGCTGGSQAPPEAMPTPTAPAATAPDGAPAVEAPPAPAATTAARSEADCMTLVADAWDDAHARVGSVSDADLTACCSTIADARDGRGESSTGWADRSDCCKLLNWTGSMTCTPWGPPVPPTA